MRDEIRGLRAELQTAQSRDSELERRVKTLEDEKTVLQETLQRERAERSYAAKSIRELDDRTGRLEKKPPPYDAIERYVRETVSSLMPSFRGQLQETVALHTAVQPSNVPYRQQIDSGKPIPQGPAGYPHPNNRQYGRGGPQRNHGPRPQDQYQYQNGSRDGPSDRGHFHPGPRYQGPPSHPDMNRDDDKRQSHPRPMSSGSHSSSENGHYVNLNNWPRRQGGWDNDKSRRADSPRRDRERSRSPDRRKDREPTLDYIEPEPMPRLRSANWVGGSSTDPELSPISSFPPSEKSRAHSEIQDSSSFTERDARNEDSKPPSGPRSSHRPARSPERGRGKSTSRPIRQ
ncbi:hypothetical protein OH76DRAFT_419433 [Lentinus brumalis]|uniref:Uncharacterized protein n=1 Tax=Lentinus brumalis TaxID=2498619 RepID=A0A371DWD4_9APHY|nr:hypothetical protein OH76DRAFT_419433 [Polyporus brumalis]